MVKITLEYGSVEEAIQALGKLSGLAKVRRAATTTGAAPSVPAGQAAEAPQGSVTAPASTITANLVLPDTSRARKGRSDKGKPRGPHKEAAAPESKAAAPAAPDDADKADPAGVVPPVVAAPSEQETKAALESYFEKHGPQKAMQLLADFGVSRLRDLPEGDRAKFIEACK